jgi:hypothetical protein
MIDLIMNFSPQSKVWIYQSSRQFTNAEVQSIQQKLDEFTSQWKAHGQLLNAKAIIPYQFFIVFIVDENTAATTGCAIDASVKVVKEIEATYQVDLFNRFNMAYKIGDQVYVNSKEDFETLISSKQINAETIVFNNLVQTLADFEQKWEVPISQSWHKLVFATQLEA